MKKVVSMLAVIAAVLAIIFSIFEESTSAQPFEKTDFAVEQQQPVSDFGPVSQGSNHTADTILVIATIVGILGGSIFILVYLLKVLPKRKLIKDEIPYR
jgi:hypothetical protein